MKSEVISSYLEAISKITYETWLTDVTYISDEDFIDSSFLGLPYDLPVIYELKQHCCYGNSFNFGFYLDISPRVGNLSSIKQVYYCEGYCVIGDVFPIEHSWLKILFKDGTVKYIDPTFEYVLHKPISEYGERAVAFECTIHELSNILLRTMKFGPFMGNPKFDPRLKK